ncbi:Na/Pi-cotransporter II-related protein [uncultured Blautia sp.]|nr:Na/Pi symporter [uncultured Blautia sp.]SCH93615.1 Na/Pi-cotransporter II-related protein [uncultured Blautia sp.]
MNENVKVVFGLIGGLALFLYGMNSMSDALQKAAGERMKKILGFLTRNPIMGALAGALVTAVLQSSSATTVMVIGFVSAGLMSLPQAISVIFGANIGTTMTAQLMAFKISNYIYPITLVWLPLIPLMVKIVTTIIRGNDKTEKAAFEPKYLDMKVIEQPAAAMVLVSKELNRLGELAESLLSDLKTAIVADGDSKTHGSFIENLEIVHQLQDSVTEYITRLFASGNLTEQQSEQTAGLLYVNNSIQRIADRCEDIDQICEKVNNNGKRLTSEASSEMEDCIDIIQQLLKKAMEAIRKGDAVVAETVFKNKKKMHKAEKKYSKAHLNRVKNEVCDASMTRYFSGIMYNFDRMADNCVSIAEEACDNVAFINLDEETGKSMMERGAV